jgi:Holliday junction DNA helicase RuvB
MAILNQILNSVWNKSLHNEKRFDEIIGHDDVKIIFNKALLSKKPVHILLVGKPGTAKTMFLTEVMQSIKHSYFVVGSNSTKAGIVNLLFERKPKYLLIDEIDKMNGTDQTSLLDLMETGIISETKIKKTREMELTSWVFATANSIKTIMEPLLSRFLILEIPEYTYEQFRELAVRKLTNEKVDENIVSLIAEKVWQDLGSKNIRDVIKISRLANNAKEVSFIVDILSSSKLKKS